VIGIDPLYFLDEMSMDETIAIIKARNEQDEAIIKRTWEQTRTICFYNALVMGAKDLKKPKDLFLLSWERKKNENNEDAPRTVEEAMERHRKIKLNKYRMK